MGTSSSFKGPKNNTPLLPSWAPPPTKPMEDPQTDPVDSPNDNSDEKDLNPKSANPKETVSAPLKTGSWTSARRGMTSFVGNGGKSTLGKAGRSYISALGGAKGASGSALFGKSAIAAFSGFLGNVVNTGINNTLSVLNLSAFIGKPVDEVLGAIIDKISPSGTTTEEAVSRKALLDVMEYLYTTLDLQNQDVNALDSISEDKMRECIVFSVSAYIYERWLNELSLAIEEKTISESAAIKMEHDIKDYVFEVVKVDLAKYDVLSLDFNSGEGKQVIDEIFETAYSTLK